MSRKIVGVDPGKTGAIAVWGPWGSYAVENMPGAPEGLEALFAHYQIGPGDVVFLEDAPLLVPGKGRVGAATAQRAWAVLELLLRRTGADVRTVHPRRWQAALSLTAGRGEGRTLHKRRMHRIAERLAPGVTIRNADAVLLAEYGRRLIRWEDAAPSGRRDTPPG